MFVAVKCFTYQNGLKPCRAEDGFFRCDQNNQCIERYLVRTGSKDCKSGSDEGISKLVSISITYKSIKILKVNIEVLKNVRWTIQS